MYVGYIVITCTTFQVHAGMNLDSSDDEKLPIVVLVCLLWVASLLCISHLDQCLYIVLTPIAPLQIYGFLLECIIPHS